MKQRIWELDAFRGICVLGMVAVHLIYDLGSVFDWTYPALFTLVKQWGGVLFLLLSGICVTLGTHNIRRGCIVFGFGLVCSAVTAALYFLDFADFDILIWFGVLHCLGISMILWSIFSKLPLWGLGLSGIAIAALGFLMDAYLRCYTIWLVPLGIQFPGFVSSDYFPLFPYLGFFLLGSFLGRILYAQHKSRFPSVNTGSAAVRFCVFCGKHSLAIYLLHQPVLSAVTWLIWYFLS